MVSYCVWVGSWSPAAMASMFAELEVGSGGKGGDPEVEVSPAGGLDATGEMSSEVELDHGASASASSLRPLDGVGDDAGRDLAEFQVLALGGGNEQREGFILAAVSAAMSMPFACSMTARLFMASPRRSVRVRASQ